MTNAMTLRTGRRAPARSRLGRKARLIAAALVALIGTAGMATADEAACTTVRMSDPGWTDITSTNAMLGLVLDALGYKQKVDTLSVPITFEALKNGQLDVFLGNWMPAQKRFVEPMVAAGDLVQVRTNLQGIRFTLAVPDYVAADGVKSFADLAAHADKFGSKIYGIEPGAAANQNVQKMIDSGDFTLKGWKLVESSEQGMLSQVEKAERSKNWIVFLAWEPHPMNKDFALTYLSGGDAYFGPNFGSASVNTVTRKGFAEACPNLQTLLKQVDFTVDIENAVMGEILAKGTDPKVAAKAAIKANASLVEGWLKGVKTASGEDGAAAVKAKLGL